MRKYEAQTCPDTHTHSSRLERRYGQLSDIERSPHSRQNSTAAHVGLWP